VNKMTSWQVERFALLHQTDEVSVHSVLGTFTGRTAGVRFAPAQRRQCLRLRVRPGAVREIPVEAIVGLAPAGKPASARR
jgi:hypothetical protein